jgi:hypothetical protein
MVLFGAVMIRLLLLPSIAVASCGGGIEPVVETALDPSDPRILPSGVYQLTVTDASCDVNAELVHSRQAIVVRKAGTLAGIPLPTDLPTDFSPHGGSPRQDRDLARSEQRFTMQSISCGQVGVTTTIKQLTPTRLALAYREDTCFTPCDVDYLLELVAPACAPPDDPTCVPGRRSYVDAGERVDVSCVCR